MTHRSTQLGLQATGSFILFFEADGKTATMERSCKYFQNPMVWLLVLVWTLTLDFSVTEGAAQILVRGQIGGNVTIHCPNDKERKVTFFYLQRGNEFVNGFHTLRGLTGSTPWKNTRVNNNETTVHMYGLKISHIGHYVCYIQYHGSSGIATTTIDISVTANYSKPTVTQVCNDGLSCRVTCSSHGGYPATRITWEVPEKGSENTSIPMWKLVNNSEYPNPGTMMYNSSSEADFNCSKGEIKFLRCFVGDITSDTFSVCTPTEPPSSPYVIPALLTICGVLIVTVIITLFQCHFKCKKRETGAATWNVNGCGEELTVLNETEAAQAS